MLRGVVEHDGQEPADEPETVALEQRGDRPGIGAEVAVGARLGRLEAERGHLREDASGRKLPPQARHLAHTPGDGAADKSLEDRHHRLLSVEACREACQAAAVRGRPTATVSAKASVNEATKLGMVAPTPQSGGLSFATVSTHHDGPLG